MDSLCEAIVCQVNASLDSGNFENLFSPAPGRYLRMFAAGKSEEVVGKGVGKLEIRLNQLEIPTIDAREYVESDSHNGDLALA